MKFLVAVVTAFLIGIGGLWVLWLDSKAPNVLSYFTTIFTGFAAIGTAYAAHAASKSAIISEKASNIWKQQMSIDIELAEAKELKVCLNDWYRRFCSEAYKKDQKIEELLNDFSKTTYAVQQVLIQHFQKHIDDLEHSWSNLEAAFDRTSFIEHNFEQRLRLRRLHIAHRKALNKYLETLVFNKKTELESNPTALRELLTTIYHVKDWAQEELNGQPLYRVKEENIDNNGVISTCKKDDGSFVYSSLHKSVDDWFLNINTYTDQKIKVIKTRMQAA